MGDNNAPKVRGFINCVADMAQSYPMTIIFK